MIGFIFLHQLNLKLLDTTYFKKCIKIKLYQNKSTTLKITHYEMYQF